MNAELEAWRVNFEKRWGCNLAITTENAELKIDDEKASVCPVCQEPIYEREPAEIGTFEEQKMLVRSKCI